MTWSLHETTAFTLWPICHWEPVVCLTKSPSTLWRMVRTDARKIGAHHDVHFLLLCSLAASLALNLALTVCYILFSTVPLRTPELSLTSHSSTDIQVTWQPLPAKVSRGRLSAYRLSYRTAADSTVASVEIPQNITRYLLEGLQPDTIYLLRMAAATRAGWCEPSAWTSHRTPKTSSSNGKRPERALRSFTLLSSRQTAVFCARLYPFMQLLFQEADNDKVNHTVPDLSPGFWSPVFIVAFRIPGGSLELMQLGQSLLL